MNQIQAIFRPELTRLLLSHIRERQADLGTAYGKIGAVSQQPPAAGALARPATTTWEPSSTAMLLVNIAARNHEAPPKIAVSIRSAEPLLLAKEIQAAIESSGMSYHANLAEAIEAGKPIQSAAPAPTGPHPFDNAVMVALTGQIHTTLNTPFGRASLIWHRTEEQAEAPKTGYVGKIHSVSLGIEHPQLGPIIANINLSHQDLSVSVRCTEASENTIKDNLPSLVSSLWGSGMIPFVNLASLPHE